METNVLLLGLAYIGFGAIGLWIGDWIRAHIKGT